MHIPFLDLPAQQKRMGSGLQDRVAKVMDHCRFVLGPEVEELEKKLQEFTGVSHAVTVSSGTDALLLMLMAEGVKAGDGVLLPSFTYVATAEVICLLGAVPIFVDVDPKTYQISPTSLEAKIQEYQGKLPLKVILGVDLFGHPAPWNELKAIADKSGITLLSDCAQSFGGKLDGKFLGNQAVATGLSFFPSKPLGCYGDGGCVLTNDPERAALYRSIRNHGCGDKRYEIKRLGLNARLDTLQAAVLLSKLEIFTEDLARRAKVAERYNDKLPELFQRPQCTKGAEPAWSVYCVQVDTERRDDLAKFLEDNGIAHAIYYPKPLHMQDAYKQGNKEQDGLIVSEMLAKRVIALPIYPDLTEQSQDYVIEKLQEWAKG